MPPYCEEHQMYHNSPTEHHAMRDRARRAAKAEALREKAERIARRIASEHSDTHDWHVAYAAALAALTEKESAR